MATGTMTMTMTGTGAGDDHDLAADGISPALEQCHRNEHWHRRGTQGDEAARGVGRSSATRACPTVRPRAAVQHAAIYSSVTCCYEEK